MNDLISRQAAIEAIERNAYRHTYIDQIVGIINDLPSVQERKKGRWIHDGYDFPHGNDWIHCSECGKRGINVPADLTNYCPDCGAKMEGAEDARRDE